MKAIIEGLLFVSGEEGLSKEELLNLTDIKEEELDQYLEELKQDCQSDQRGIDLAYLGNKYKFTTKSIHQSYYKKMAQFETEKNLSDAALETLAIIAYKEPITRLEIDSIRGVNSNYVLRGLLLKGLITVLGKSDIAGRPNIYGITNRCLDYFGLSSSKDLPKIEFEQTNNSDDEMDLFKSKYQENNN